MPKSIKGSRDEDQFESDGTNALAGGHGDDTYIVTDSDTQILERNNGGHDTVEAFVDFTLPQWVERLILKGSDPISGAGNELANEIVGNDANNTIFGGEGDDTVTGGGGSDLIDGGAGFDTAVFDGPSTSYVISLVGDEVHVSFALDDGSVETDILRDVEALSFADGVILVADLLPDEEPPQEPAAPTAANDGASLEEDSIIEIDVLANDTGTGLSVISTGQPSKGTVTIGENGVLLYEAAPNATGSDSFEYTLADESGNTATATVEIDILPVNDQPLAEGDVFSVAADAPFESTESLLGNDSDPDGDVLTADAFQGTTALGGSVTVNEDGTFLYEPPAEYSQGSGLDAVDSFNYTVTDGQGGTATGEATLILESSSSNPDPAPSLFTQALLGDDSERLNAGEDFGTGAVVTFAFAEEVPDYYATEGVSRTGFRAFSEAQRQATYDLFDEIESFTQLTFVETALEDAEMVFGLADSGSFAFHPSVDGVGNTDSDVWINENVAGDTFEYGSAGYFALVHEVGHAIGLMHPNSDLVLHDRSETVMSYKAHPESWEYPSSYMPEDIEALQYLYGSNDAATSGDDTYTFAEFDERVATIWDAGGHDTIDMSGATRAVEIDMNSGGYSTIASASANNIALDYDTVIEDAIGGAYDDIIAGNEVDNTIIGGAGNDTLSGGEGSDTFGLGIGSGADTITDFQKGADLIDLRGSGLGFADLAITSVDGVSVVGWGDDQVTVEGAESLEEEDFLFD